MAKGDDYHSMESELMCLQIMNAKPENPELVKKSKGRLWLRAKDSILRHSKSSVVMRKKSNVEQLTLEAT